MSVFQPQDADYLKRVTAVFDEAAFLRYIGAELAKLEPGYAEIHLPAKPELTQQNGFLHAGALGTIADHAGGCAASTLIAAHEAVLTVEYKLNLMTPGDGERAIARASVLRAGRSLTICRVDVFMVKQGSEKHCAAQQMTLMTIPLTSLQK
jgi:uncharacterized protein (TIGR00369 family)